MFSNPVPRFPAGKVTPKEEIKPRICTVVSTMTQLATTPFGVDITLPTGNLALDEDTLISQLLNEGWSIVTLSHFQEHEGRVYRVVTLVRS